MTTAPLNNHATLIAVTRSRTFRRHVVLWFFKTLPLAVDKATLCHRPWECGCNVKKKKKIKEEKQSSESFYRKSCLTWSIMPFVLIFWALLFYLRMIVDSHLCSMSNFELLWRQFGNKTTDAVIQSSDYNFILCLCGPTCLFLYNINQSRYSFQACGPCCYLLPWVFLSCRCRKTSNDSWFMHMYTACALM